MSKRPFENTTEPTLRKLLAGLLAVVEEAPPDHGALTCALLAGLVKAEIAERTQQTRMNTGQNKVTSFMREEGNADLMP